MASAIGARSTPRNYRVPRCLYGFGPYGAAPAPKHSSLSPQPIGRNPLSYEGDEREGRKVEGDKKKDEKKEVDRKKSRNSE